MTPTLDAAGESPSEGLLRPWQFFLLAGMLGATATVIVATGQPPASIVTLSLTVVAAGFAALGAYRTLLPLVSPEAAEAPALIGGRTRIALEREKMLVLRSIKELEFDYAMGKLSASDFEEMSGRLRSRAIGLLQQLQDNDGYRAIIERELRVRLATFPADAPMPAAASPSGDAIEPAASSYQVPTCGSCGVENDADARFCKSCGTRLS